MAMKPDTNLGHLQTTKNHSQGGKRIQAYVTWKSKAKTSLTVVAGLGERQNETLRHKTKGDADYKTHEGNGKHVDTIRNQGRQSDW